MVLTIPKDRSATGRTIGVRQSKYYLKNTPPHTHTHTPCIALALFCAPRPPLSCPISSAKVRI